MSSVTHIVDDEKVLNEYEYDAWGEVVSEKEIVKNRFKFNGQQLDPITQQYYLRARFYNPVIARFTQEDTYRGDGLNLYAYCRNNPVYYVDPTGNARDRTCIKDAYREIRASDPSLSPKEAHEAAQKQVAEERLSEYLLRTNQDALTATQKQEFIDRGLAGDSLRVIEHGKSGLETLVSVDANGRIQLHTGTVTHNTIGNGTGVSGASRTWLKNQVENFMNLPASIKKHDYGHIVGKESGGGGGINALNGFVQDRTINRGAFSQYQTKIKNLVTPSNDAYIFTRFKYDSSGEAVVGFDYNVSFSLMQDLPDKNFGN